MNRQVVAGHQAETSSPGESTCNAPPSSRGARPLLWPCPRRACAARRLERGDGGFQVRQAEWLAQDQGIGKALAEPGRFEARRERERDAAFRKRLRDRIGVF